MKFILLFFFFLTGLTGLVYELVWTRMLILVFGSTQFAITTVLTTFMTGLALGSIAFGRLVDRKSNPLKIYALIELSIGLYCFFTPTIFDLIKSLYIGSFAAGQTYYSAFNSTQFLFSFLGIIIPTTLMGGTLPVLIKYFSLNNNRIGHSSGLLYAVNTLGAVTGTLFTGMFLLYFLGIKSSLYLAGSIDTIVGVLLLAIGGIIRKNSGIISQSSGVAQKVPDGVSSANPHKDKRNTMDVIVISAFCLSGFIALAYEVLWTRVLSLVLGSSIYAFTVILTAFLLGISLGSILFSRFVDRQRHHIFWFGILEGIIGISAIASIFSFKYLPFIFSRMYQAFSHNFWLFTFLQFLLSLSVMAIPTLSMGAIFPVVSKIYTRRKRGVGTSIGSIYFSNTIGSIVGSFSAGFIMIPFIGIQKSIFILAVINILLCIVLLVFSEMRRGANFFVIGATVMISMFLIFNLPSWDKEVMTLGPYVNPIKQNYSDIKGKLSDDKLLYYKEGLNALITVRKRGDELSYQANGKYEAIVNGDRPAETWYVLGHIPMLLSKKTENALLVGLGSGITLGAMEEYPVKEIDVVELEPAVIEAANFFSRVNGDAVSDQRVSMHITDGRSFVASTDKKYDVIVSGVSDPWISGVSNLFTREYFEDLYDHLSPDGVTAIWYQNYRTTDRDFKTGIKTFASVFPHASVWFHYSKTADLVIIGSKKEIRIELDALDKKIKSVGLNRIDVNNALQFLNLFLIGNKDLRAYIHGASINTDNKPILEFTLPMQMYSPPDVGQNERVMDMLKNAGDIIPPVTVSKNAMGVFYLRLGLEYLNYVFRDEQTVKLFKKVLIIDPQNKKAKSGLKLLK